MQLFFQNSEASKKHTQLTLWKIIFAITFSSISFFKKTRPQKVKYIVSDLSKNPIFVVIFMQIFYICTFFSNCYSHYAMADGRSSSLREQASTSRLLRRETKSSSQSGPFPQMRSECVPRKLFIFGQPRNHAKEDFDIVIKNLKF